MERLLSWYPNEQNAWLSLSISSNIFIVFFEQAEATRLENPNFQQKVMQTFGLTLGQKDSTCVIVSPDVGHLFLRYFQLRGFVNGTALATVQVQLGEVILNSDI